MKYCTLNFIKSGSERDGLFADTFDESLRLRQRSGRGEGVGAQARLDAAGEKNETGLVK